jgi:hypothetical protein
MRWAKRTRRLMTDLLESGSVATAGSVTSAASSLSMIAESRRLTASQAEVIVFISGSM